MNNVRTLRYISLAVGLSLVAFCVATVIMIAAARGAFDPKPFDGVRVVSVEKEGDAVRIVATYRKRDCEIRKMVVFGETLGLLAALDYTVRRGANQEFSRIAGRQVMDITIDTDGQVFTDFEIRTRHDCDGQTVDSIFLHVEAPE